MTLQDLKFWDRKPQAELDITPKGVVDRVHAESIGILNSGGGAKEAMWATQVGDVDATLATKIYSRSPYVNAAVRILAGCLSIVPIKVYIKERSGVNKNEKLTGEPYGILNWVNPHMTKCQLLENTVSWIALVGEAFWALEATPKEFADMSPGSIYPMNPQWVKMVPDPDTGVRAYLYQVGKNKIYLTEDRVVHFKGFHPDDYWHGHNQLNALQSDVQIERYARKQMANFFNHAAVISGVLKIPEDPDDDEIRKIKKEFFVQYGGARNSYRIMVLTNGMEYEPLKANMEDTHTVDVLNQSLDTHAIVMGVPAPILLGKLEGGHGKLIEPEALMWKKTIIPMGTMIEQVLTKKLAMPLSNRLVIEFDYSNVEALRAQDLDRARVEVAHVMSGIRPPNEIRKERSWAPYTGDNAEFGDTPTPKYTIDNPVSPSLGLPGSQGGRDQSSTGEAQMADTTGRRSAESIDILGKFVESFMAGDGE